MSDTVFRSKIEAPVAKEPTVVATNPAKSDTTNIPVPYTDSKDFLDNYFEIGTQWKDHDASFYPELEKIGNYIESKIKDGEIANDQEAVKDLLKGIEKINNLRKESRAVVKLEVLANYIEFLMKNDSLKSNLKRYAH